MPAEAQSTIMRFLKRNKFQSESKGSGIIRHIVIGGVLCLFMLNITAQIRPGELQRKVQKSQEQQKQTTRRQTPRRPVQTQHPLPPVAPIVSPLDNKQATLVYLENSDNIMFDQLLNPDVQLLRGNVRFRHDNAFLFCDSAYFYSQANSFDAFSNVRIVQGDTLFVYGDYLFYDGNLKLARLRQNVRMENRKTTLTTDSLNYDRLNDLAYYFTGGKIQDDVNTLTSVWGQYSPATDDALFKTQVNLVNENFILETDTLKYNTKTNIANIVGPTHIKYKDETDIYSNLGWYNTSTELMMLLNRSEVQHKGGKNLIGDTVYYDKRNKYGEAFNRVILNDTVEKKTLYGNYIYYNDSTEVGLATDSALLVDWSSPDTMYVHADTLHTSKDSIYEVARAYYNVRFFREDIQGLCDSLAYSARDSVMNLFGQPVLWNEESQLSGEIIQAFTKNKTVEKVHIQQSAMAVQHQDSIYFNQISGKEMIAHVDSGQLYRVDVSGNAETIYYPVDEGDSTIIGLNKTQSSYVILHFNEKKIEKIVLTAESSGAMYPLDKVQDGDLYLKNYFWLIEQRPKTKDDLFLRFPKTPRTKNGGSTSDGVRTSTPPVVSSQENEANQNQGRPNTNAGTLPAGAGTQAPANLTAPTR